MNQFEIKQKLDQQLVVLKNLPNLLEKKLGISSNDFLFMSALVGKLYNFKHMNYLQLPQLHQESPPRQLGSSPSKQSKPSFVQIEKILSDNHNLNLLIKLLTCDLESDPGAKQVEEYHLIIDDIINLLGGESEGRVHTLYAIADIARGKVHRDQVDQKLLCLKSQNSIDVLVFFSGIASLSSITSQLPQKEQDILFERIKSTLSLSSQANSILHVLKLPFNLVEQLFKLIYTPNRVNISDVIHELRLNRVFDRNRQLEKFIKIMLRPTAAARQDRYNSSPSRYRDSFTQFDFGSGSNLMSKNYNDILQLALHLHNGNTQALSQYSHLNHHFSYCDKKDQQNHQQILKSLLSIINPKCTVPLYDNFRALMVGLRNQKGANAIKLANLDIPLLNQIQESCGILKQALASVIIAMEQFPGNMKAGWFERAVLKKLRGEDQYKLRISYQGDEYLEQANYLQNKVKNLEEDQEEGEQGQNKYLFDFKTTEYDFYQMAVFNKFAKYGYNAKVDLLKQTFGYERKEIEELLGEDESAYYQHFISVWGKDVEPEQFFESEQQVMMMSRDQYASNQSAKKEQSKIIEEILKDKKVDLITKKRLSVCSDDVRSLGGHLSPPPESINEKEMSKKYAKNAGMLKKRWTVQADREQIQNIWQGVIVPLTKAGHVQIADILFAWNILALRQIAKNPDKVKKNQDAYNVMLQRIDDILHYIELNGLANNIFDQNFDKFRFVKLIGMALGVKISALAEKWFLQSVSSSFKKTIESYKVDELESSSYPRQDFDHQSELLQKAIQAQMINYSWGDIEDFYTNQNDEQDLRNLYFRCYPYEDKYQISIQQKPKDQNLFLFDGVALENQQWKNNMNQSDAQTQTKTKEYKLPKSVQDLPKDRKSYELDALKAYFIALQQVTFIDSQYYQFIMELSQGHLQVWDRNQFLLQSNNLISQNDLRVVKGLTELINLRKLFQTHLKERFGQFKQQDDSQDWQVPEISPQDEELMNQNDNRKQDDEDEEAKKEQIKEIQRKVQKDSSSLPDVQQILEPLLSVFAEQQPINIKVLSELIAFSLGTPNTHNYETISQNLQISPEISALLHTSAFTLARVIIPGLPVYWTNDQQLSHEDQMNIIKNQFEQYAEFSESISKDQYSPFNPVIVAALAFLPYNKKLALQMLFTDSFKKQKQDDEDEDVLEQSSKEKPNDQQNKDSIKLGPLHLDRFLRQVRFTINLDNNPALSAVAAQRILDVNSSFSVNQNRESDHSEMIFNHFSKQFIYELPYMLKSLAGQQNDKLLVISHILIGVISGVALNCYQDAVTTLQFLKQSELVDKQLYNYIQHLIYQKLDMQIIQDQIEQLQNLQTSQLYQASLGRQEQDDNQGNQNKNNRRMLADISGTQSAPPPLFHRNQQMEGENQLDHSLDQGIANKAAAQMHPGIKRILDESAKVEDEEVKLKDKSYESQGQMSINSRQQQISLQELKEFRCEEVLKQSTDCYKISILGKIKGQFAILKVQRAALIMDQVLDYIDSQCQQLKEQKNHLFSQQEDQQPIEMDSQENSKSEPKALFEFHDNKPAIKYQSATCTFINAQFKRFKLIPDIESSPKTIECELVYPADSTLILKERERKTVVIDQTKQIYLSKTLRIIQDEPKQKLEWIRNIFKGFHKEEKIILDKQDQDNEYVLIEDYDYDFKMPDIKFHALAIPKNSRLRTIRDLRKEHLPMLRNIMAQSLKSIEAHYNIMSYELIAYFHYLPTFYWLHIHFSHAENMGSRNVIGRAIMLRDVIQNLELKSNYYEDATLPIRMKEGDKLIEEIRKENEANSKQQQQ